MILFKAEMVKTPLPVALEMETSISPVILMPPIPLKPLMPVAMILSTIGAVVPWISAVQRSTMSMKFTAVAGMIPLPVLLAMTPFMAIPVKIP